MTVRELIDLLVSLPEDLKGFTVAVSTEADCCSEGIVGLRRIEYYDQSRHPNDDTANRVLLQGGD